MLVGIRSFINSYQGLYNNHFRPYAPALRLSPRVVMREARVVGFMPSNSAAPPGPNTLPPVCFSAVAMQRGSPGSYGNH
jgi:hypothetical protein